MVNLLQSLADCINDSDIGIKAQLAYNTDFLQRPVLEPAVYITYNEVRGGAVDFLAYVYSPVGENGSGCLKAAQSVCKALTSETSRFFLGSLSLSGIDYNSNSVAFLVKISGTVNGCFGENLSIGGYSATAYNFANNEELSVDVPAENISVICDCSPYPIMTICSGKAIDTVEGDKSYNITLSGVSPILVNTIFSAGAFTLRLTRGTTVEEYLKCSCIKSQLNTYSDNEKSYLNVISYEKITLNEEQKAEEGEVVSVDE